jgi:hypothetical protein
MTSKRRRAAPRRGAAPVRRGVPWWAIAIGLLVVGASLWWWRSGTSPTPPVSAPAFDPRLVYRQAMELVELKRYLESLPLLEKVVAAEPGLSQVHHDYATAMLNAVHQNRTHLGRYEYAVRSAPERIALVNHAIVELAAAERTAGNDRRARAWAIRTRAQAFGAWGFPWEALVGYRQAENVDPTWDALFGRAEHVLDEMEHPEKVQTVP